ncbi:hypothetical protein THRCLA_09701 [Thraustotheca clavata]|uniref:LicD/FKTN/FKRP nucleotidyltransferase domain-containing protein n=1 Tax=Thraustotheca clavata TaxID=74557 RepID=A0A1V9YUY5_9STRA|nr:hypothetical protein THRCLA_09701 [Thraustotheca clavata]
MDEAGIEYWVDSGTLLGVYRNKGLIPHDIDADVGLTQAGFEKIRQTKLNIPENYELFVNNSPHYRNGPFDFLPGRFADKRTGLYVDLFEFLPLQNTIQVSKNKTFKFEVSGGQANEYRNGNTTLLMHTDKDATVYMEMEVVEEEVIEQLAPVASVAWWACTKCPEYRHFIVPKDWIYPLQRCPFDGKEVWCPAKQKEYLVMLYGDNFMEPQNPNDR